MLYTLPTEVNEALEKYLSCFDENWEVIWDYDDFSVSQKRGAEITYGRRYNLQQILNIQAEDDDGNKASWDTKEEDNKPCFSQANLEALAKVMDRFGSIDECIKSARDKYKVSNKAKEAIIHAYNTWEITKL